MRYSLTKRQRDLVDFVRQYIAKHNLSPSYQEIRDGLQLRSNSGVHRLVTGAARRGALTYIPHHGRSLALVSPEDSAPVPGQLSNAVAKLRQAVERFLSQGIESEDPDQGTAVVSSELLGDLDLAFEDLDRPHQSVAS